MSTDRGRHRGYIYGAPVVADLDGDGFFEVVVGTSLGMVYVLDAATGHVYGAHRADGADPDDAHDAFDAKMSKAFPLNIGSAVETDIAVADLVGDDHLELLVATADGILACLGIDGTLFWHRRLSGATAGAPTIGDVDGDGELDVAVAVATPSGKEEGHLWVVRGSDGSDLPHFPKRLARWRGRESKGAEAGGKRQHGFTSPVLLVDLHEVSAGSGRVALTSPSLDESIRRVVSGVGAGGSSRKTAGPAAPMGGFGGGLHLVVPSLDGHVYVVEGSSGCGNKLDVGDKVFAMPLAGDVSGSGELELLLSTASGDALLMSVGVKHHPANAWTSQRRARRNGFVHGGHMGLHVVNHPRQLARVVAERVALALEIVDNRPRGSPQQMRWYKVSVFSGADTRRALVSRTFSSPGFHTIEVDLGSPQRATLLVSMDTEHGLHYEAAVEVGYNTGFHHVLKWMLMGPVLLAASAMLLLGGGRKKERSVGPSAGGPWHRAPGELPS